MNALLLALALGACAATIGRTASREELAAQVRAAESAFAATMAARDAAAFAGFVSEEALFFGGKTVLRGRAAVAEGWARFFAEPDPPFSWESELVEVLDSGTLALSSGPVKDPDGAVVATFNSIWRREADGRWRVVFDKGSPVCPPEPQP
jgi:ketosteroid isomerase-like protein